MKKVKIDIFKSAVFFYAPSEMLEFERDYNLKVGTDSYGKQCGNGVWVKQKKIGLVAHECVHLCDWLIHDRLETGAVKEEICELRAYITEYFIEQYAKYLDKKTKGEKGK